MLKRFSISMGLINNYLPHGEYRGGYLTIHLSYNRLLVNKIVNCSLKHFLQILQNLKFTYAKFLL